MDRPGHDERYALDSNRIKREIKFAEEGQKGHIRAKMNSYGPAKARWHPV